MTRKGVAKRDECAKEEAEAPIYGDVLEAILSRVPLIHLVNASHVSKSWNTAVYSSLHRHIPWLIVHTQSNRSPYLTTTHAYDPRSHVWIQVLRPSIDYVSALRSSASNLLYMLSPTKLSFSSDQLHLTWQHVDAPRVWRTDPIVALVHNRVIVAGGTCDFEDDPLAVEVYDLKSATWDTCESMPTAFKDSASSTWLSVATDNRRLFISDKYSGAVHWFNPETKAWSGPYELRPNAGIFYSVIGFSNNRLIMIGLIGSIDEMKGVRIWEVNRKTFDCKEIGEMPSALVQKLVNSKEMFHFCTINVCMAGNIVYICNASDVEEVILCQFIDGGCEWRSVRNVVVGGYRNPKERFVFICSEIGLLDLEKAMMRANLKFASQG